MKQLVTLAVMILFLAATASAQGPAGVGGSIQPPNNHAKRHVIEGAIVSGAVCGVSIGLSANPLTAAEIGLPILFAGNFVAFKIYKTHPKLAGIIQSGSGLGCLAGALTRHAAQHTVTHLPKPNPGPNPPPNPNPPPPPNPNPNPPPPPNPPGGHGPCIQDCGLPGNGGVNPGRDGKKPPFPGRGRPALLDFIL